MADLSRLQRLMRRFMSTATFARHEAESRKWIATCPGCGHRRSIWDLGGMRGGASGKPSTLMDCPACGQRGWHKVRYES
jgi:DNA-directed RNA polymerase subunit RPC12/RpoP